MDCDSKGRDCVGGTGTRRRDKRVRGWGDQEGEEGTEGSPESCMREDFGNQYSRE